MELACATEGASIYYTTDGTEPAASSTAYTAAIPVNSSMTIKAIAVLGTSVSSVASATYTIETSVATPTFTPAAGTYTSAQNVKINCATEGATIYYTTDGTEPTTSSTEYTAAITVSETATIKVLAVKEGLTSATAEAAYTINLLTVKPKNVNSNFYTLVSNVASLEDGDAVLIVSGNKALSTTQNANNRPAVDVTVADGTITPRASKFRNWCS